MKTFFCGFALLAVFLCSCATQDITQLHPGMSTDEVISLMGKPDSVDRDGNAEYFNYYKVSFGGSARRRAATAPGPVNRMGVTQYGNGDKDFNPSGPDGRPIHLVGETENPPSPIYEKPQPSPFAGPQPYTVKIENDHVTQYGNKFETALMHHTPNGKIRILTIDPSTAKPGQPTEFKIKISYAFMQVSSGVVQVAFNTDGPRSNRTYVSKDVTGEKGETELTVTVTPRQWEKPAAFAANAILRTGTAAAPGDTLEYHDRDIKLVP